MPGVLTHVVVSTVGLILLWSLFNWKYGLSFFIGHLIPDLIKFGIPAIQDDSLNFALLIQDPVFWKLNSFTHSFLFWILLSAFVLILTLVLNDFGMIKKERRNTWVWVNFGFIVGAVVHLILDLLIIEKSFWV